MIEVEMRREWCQGDRHPPIVTVPRGGDPKKTDDAMDIQTNLPQPCIVINGTPLCTICWMFYGQEFNKFFVKDLDDWWHRLDKYEAVRAADALMGKSA